MRTQPINIIFDGPPGAESGRFVEVELDDGSSINAGEWIKRDNGMWALRITALPPPRRSSRPTSQNSPRCAASGVETTERGVVDCPTCKRLVRVGERGLIPSHGTLDTPNSEAHQVRLQWARDIEQRRKEADSVRQ